MHYIGFGPIAVVAWVVAATAHQLRLRDVNYGELTGRLSNSSKLYLPGSDAFDAAVKRWSSLDEPVANAVVVPGTEQDVVETVCCASLRQTP